VSEAIQKKIEKDAWFQESSMQNFYAKDFTFLVDVIFLLSLVCNQLLYSRYIVSTPDGLEARPWP